MCPGTPAAPPAAICACSAPRSASRSPAPTRCWSWSGSTPSPTSGWARTRSAWTAGSGSPSRCSPRPRALVLDDPARGLLAARGRLGARPGPRHAAAGGAVLLTGRDAGALARTADHVIALDDGRVVADEAAAQFARTRLRPYVAVRSPYAQRLAELLSGDGTEVVAASGSRIAVYGTTSAAVGETAYRHGILLHQLADETGARPRRTPVRKADARSPAAPRGGVRRRRRTGRRPGPVRPLGYELRRGLRGPHALGRGGRRAGVLRTGHGADRPYRSRCRPRRCGCCPAGPPNCPLPAAAIGAGLLGALSLRAGVPLSRARPRARPGAAQRPPAGRQARGRRRHRRSSWPRRPQRPTSPCCT